MKKSKSIIQVNHDLTASQGFCIHDIVEDGPLSPIGDMHFDLQIIIVISGKFEMHYPNFSHVYEAGEVCLTGPWEPHFARILSIHTRYLVFTLDFYSLGSFFPFNDVDWYLLFFLSPAQRPLTDSRRVRTEILLIARKILKYEHTCESGYRSGEWLEIHYLLFKLRGMYLRKHPKSKQVNLQFYPAILLAKSRVKSKVTVEEAAKECGLSRSRFAEVFKKSMGVSFGDFAATEKVLAIIGELQSGMAKTIKQIAQEYGFTDISNFYRFFKRLTGCTLHEFIESNEKISLCKRRAKTL